MKKKVIIEKKQRFFNKNENRSSLSNKLRILAILTRARLFEFWYGIHIKIRYLHDKTYQRGGTYKKWSDQKYSSAVHKTIMASFIVSFIIFSLAQNLFPNFFDLTKPNTVMAGSIQKIWNTLAEFQTAATNANINFNNGDPQLSTTSGSVTENTTAQFNAGTQSNTGVNANTVLLLKPLGATATNTYECASGYILGGVCATDTVIIGTQTWKMANLNVGTMVAAGGTQSVGQKWCYSNLESNCTTYGGLYQWGLATTSGGAGQTDVCPTGFHLPTDAEYTTLTTYVGTTPGDKLKKAGLCDGRTPCGTSGFDGLLAGYFGGGSYSLSSGGYFWSSSQYDTTYAFFRKLSFTDSTVLRNYNTKTLGYSVRCLKN